MKLKQIILNMIAVLALALVPIGLQTAPAYADDPPPPPSCGNSDSAKGQVLQGVGLTGDNCNDNQVNQIFQTVVQILSLVIGAASVLVILYAGFKYIGSGGESNRVANAKNTLLYALVGLGVAALAQLLLHFVLYQTNK
jgi:hypothetical protein